jgi:hypothetical protein
MSSGPRNAAPAGAAFRSVHHAPKVTPVAKLRLSCCCAMASRDLLIVGPGVLGSRAGCLWKEEFPAAKVMAQTNTETSHTRSGHYVSA